MAWLKNKVKRVVFYVALTAIAAVDFVKELWDRL